MTETKTNTKLTLTVPKNGEIKAYSNFNYSNLKLDADDEKLYDFAIGVMAFQAVKGTEVTVTRESELA